MISVVCHSAAMKLRMLLVGVTLFSLGFLAVLLTQASVAPPQSVAARPSTANPGLNMIPGGPLTACDPGGTPAQLAWVARMKPGYSEAALNSVGVRSVPAITGVSDWLVVLFPLQQGRGIDAGRVQSDPDVVIVTKLNAETSDPALRSCNYKMTDNASALAIANIGISALEARGVVTPSQVADPNTTLLLTEDPTNAQHLLVVVTLAIPPPQGSAPASPTFPVLVSMPYAVALDRTTHAVLFAGPANWDANP